MSPLGKWWTGLQWPFSQRSLLASTRLCFCLQPLMFNSAGAGLPLFYFSHPFGKVLSKQGPCSPNTEKSWGHRRREHMEPKVKKHLSANIWTAVSGLCLSAMTAWSFDKLSWSLIISSERHAELFGEAYVSLMLEIGGKRRRGRGDNRT